MIIDSGQAIQQKHLVESRIDRDTDAKEKLMRGMRKAGIKETTKRTSCDMKALISQDVIEMEFRERDESNSYTRDHLLVVVSPGRRGTDPTER